MALNFGTLIGAVTGNIGYKVASKAVKAASKTAIGAGIGRGAHALGSVPGAVAGKFGVTQAANIKKFSGTMGGPIASHLPVGTNLFMKPVPRALPNASLTGAAAKAQQKMVNKSVNNLYLGMKLNVPTDIAVGAVVGAGTLGAAAYQHVRDESTGNAKMGQVNNIGLAPRLSGPPDMGATGDLVLALNRRR